MRLATEVRASLDTELESRGLGPVRSLEPVGGGCITETGRIRTASGADFFLKWSPGGHPAGLFSAEATSLTAIAEAGALRVPAVIAFQDVRPGQADHHDARWLLLEWLVPGPPVAHTWAALGHGLAALHRHRVEAFGWPESNFIGTLTQPNAWCRSWPEFWQEQRLLPQIRKGRDSGHFDQAETGRFDALAGALDDLLGPAAQDGPSLLHGDLWSGNLHVLESGDPALVDPASYYGHREVDLAMSDLFGGFDVLFRAAYDEAWRLQPGYARRRAVYQLYYLLVHLNLFGGAYRERCLASLRTAGF